MEENLIPPESPDELLDLVRDAFVDLRAIIDDPKSRQLDGQLREVARSIEALERLGLSIPDELRQLKTRLAVEAAAREEASERLKVLSKGMRDIVKEFADEGATPASARRPAGNPGAPRTRRTRGDRTTQEQLGEYLVEALKALPPGSKKNTILDKMRQLFGDRFKPGDFETRSSGEVIWENNAAWARYKLILAGVLKADSPYGVWELADRGGDGS